MFATTNHTEVNMKQFMIHVFDSPNGSSVGHWEPFMIVGSRELAQQIIKNLKRKARITTCMR